jgi:hypothetical protein
VRPCAVNDLRVARSVLIGTTSAADRRLGGGARDGGRRTSTFPLAARVDPRAAVGFGDEPLSLARADHRRPLDQPPPTCDGTSPSSGYAFRAITRTPSTSCVWHARCSWRTPCSRPPPWWWCSTAVVGAHLPLSQRDHPMRATSAPTLGSLALRRLRGGVRRPAAKTASRFNFDRKDRDHASDQSQDITAPIARIDRRY